MNTKTKPTLYLEIHFLQNFSPSNLNRDDTGAPKSAMFGMARRARISSQCSKRGARDHFATSGSIEANLLSVRTKRAPSAIGEILAHDHDLAESTAVACRVFESIGLKRDKDNADATACLLFMPERHLKSIAGVIHEHWTELAMTKNGEVPPVPKAISARVAQIVADASRAPEIALNGRMIAEGKGLGMEAAAQVAHTDSTHESSTENDFFTALDDLAPKGDHASAHMDSASFLSACHYRYATVSVPSLRENLADDELVLPTLRAFLEAQIAAIPTGKQASSAAHNPPSYVLAVVHAGQPYSLSNAFVGPAHPGAHGLDLVGESILALRTYWNRLGVMYPDARPHLHAIAFADRDVTCDSPGITEVTSLRELMNGAIGFLTDGLKTLKKGGGAP